MIARASLPAMRVFLLTHLRDADDVLLRANPNDLQNVATLSAFYVRHRLFSELGALLQPMWAGLYSMPTSYMDMNALRDTAICQLDALLFAAALYVDTQRTPDDDVTFLFF